MPRGENFKGRKIQGGGRTKGSLNKTTKILKAYLLSALYEVGGVYYLKDIALNHPKVFCGLLRPLITVNKVRDSTILIQIEGLNGTEVELITQFEAKLKERTNYV